MIPLTAYRRAFDALPQPLRAARQDIWSRFTDAGLPGRRDEDWRYTDLSGLNDAEFTPGSDRGQVDVQTPGVLERWEYINGHAHTQAGRDTPAPTLADDGVTQLNASLTRGGMEWRIPARGPLAQRHLISWHGSDGTMGHLRHRIVVERGAEATLLVDVSGSDARTLATDVAEIELEAGSRLRLLRLQTLGAQATHIARTQVRVARDAALEYTGLDLGGALTRHDLNVDLVEPGASVTLAGVFAPNGRSHHDTHTRIHHLAPHTTSRETYRGLVFDRAHAVFNGRILVGKDAQKTDSAQHLASLLLSPKAEINAKPELEIYADDVKCAHGATCGQLDEMAIYYLRSRGLDRATAENLLLYTFVHEVFAGIADAELRRHFERRMLARLPGGAALEDLL